MKIEHTFFTHHKTRKLEKLLGNNGIVSLLKLWNYAEQVRPDGVLSGMDISDIELVADWDREQTRFVEALLQIGFLDERDGVLCLHDYLSPSPFMERGAGGEVEETVSDAGRFNALKRTNPQIHDELKKLGIRTLSKEGYDLWKDCRGRGDKSGKGDVEVILPPVTYEDIEEEEDDFPDFDNDEDYYNYLIENNYIITPVDLYDTGKSNETLLREHMGENLFGNYVKMLTEHRALAA